MEQRCDVCIVGAGTGAYAAALAMLSAGLQVIMLDEGDRIGGQFTAQAVPPDEHPWIEMDGVGCTASYRKFRKKIRAYYRDYYPLLETVKKDAVFNPGSGSVSPLCHEPIIADRIIKDSLHPYVVAGLFKFFKKQRITSVLTESDSITAVRSISNEEELVVYAQYYLDASELGDLIDKAGIEHVVGAESWQQTGEPHALEIADPMDQQAFTWCFAFDYVPGVERIIRKPETYEFWKTYKASFWPDYQLSWSSLDPVTLTPVYRPLFAGPMNTVNGDDLWHYRRILYKGNFKAGFFNSDIVIANWPQMDYWLGPLIGVSEEEKESNLKASRELSLSLLYWMQTEAPRMDGGYGYAGLGLRADVMGTEDGLAAAPYIRESRRIQAMFTVREQHIGTEARGSLVGAESFHDSVGVGSYRIDLHPSTSGRSYIDINTWPFQIPLGALLPVRCKNVIAASKTIGTTHISNGCYRLHPVEWNIGEAAGFLAAYCIDHKKEPKAVYEKREELDSLQQILHETYGIPLKWPESIRVSPRHKINQLGF